MYSLALILLSIASISVSEPLTCHFCLHSRKSKDLHDGENQNPDCMNKLKFGAREDQRRVCTPLEEWCASTVTNINGFFVMVDRGCAEECVPGCEAHGYGLFWQECTRCCNTPLCNEWDGKAYYLPNAVLSPLKPFLFVIYVFVIFMLGYF